MLSSGNSGKTRQNPFDLAALEDTQACVHCAAQLVVPMKGKVPCGSSQLTRLTCWEDRELAFKGSTLELHWVLAGGRGAGILGRQAFREGWEKYGMFEGLDSANPGQRRTQRNILDRGQILESPVCCVGLGGQCPGLQEAELKNCQLAGCHHGWYRGWAGGAGGSRR